MELARSVGANRVELYTEAYARAFGSTEESPILSAYEESAKTAIEAGLGVNAGHDLNLDNLGRFAKAVPGLLEVSIGHALMADALELGYAQAVKAYLDRLSTQAHSSEQVPAPRAAA